ncbi:MAG TPA: glycosyltransferase [Bryobacteraceae bacterium]|jgi:glycosyltransferase involved in cell wall biosynthesis
MKVLHVIPSMSPARGGPSIVLRSLMTPLVDRGVTVHVAATDDDGPAARLRVPYGVAVPEGGASVFYFPRETCFYSFSRPLARWLAQHVRDYDLIHIHALFSFPSVAAARQARRQGVPYVIRPLGTLSAWGLKSRRPLLKRWSLAWIEKPLLRDAAAVQATSEMEVQEILRVCPEARVIAIPNPVETPVGPLARPEPAAPFTILFLSRLDRKKGLEQLLAAFDRCVKVAADLHLIVAGGGDPDYVDSLRESASKGIRFTGAVDGEQKRLLFSQAHLFVLPSHSENFGVAVVEAMAHGVPVLISPHVGIADAVAEAKAGVVTECDEETLAGSILRLSQSPAILAEMSDNARQFALRYAPELVAESLISAYESIVRGRATGA